MTYFRDSVVLGGGGGVSWRSLFGGGFPGGLCWGGAFPWGLCWGGGGISVTALYSGGGGVSWRALFGRGVFPGGLCSGGGAFPGGLCSGGGGRFLEGFAFVRVGAAYYISEILLMISSIVLGKTLLPTS